MSVLEWPDGQTSASLWKLLPTQYLAIYQLAARFGMNPERGTLTRFARPLRLE
jgi:hypothetical protein